jgi:nucleoside-triphosphatase THEP1
MNDPNAKSRVILLSGPRGVGKTTLILKMLDQLKPRQLDIAGILSLPVEEKGVKTAIDGIDLRSGETRRLAIRNTGASGQWITHQWQFDADAMQWANHVLKSSTPCDLLIVDEFGVLEFERGQGWLEGLKAVDNGFYKATVIIIRPELLVEAQQRWSRNIIFEITQETRDAALAKLSDLVTDLLLSSH